MPEKLIIGFERDELERSKAGTWCDLREADEGFDFVAWFEFGTGSTTWVWPCRPVECPQGEMALVKGLSPCGWPVSFQPTAYLSRHYPALRQGAEAREVLNTYQWLAMTDAALRDWSGFDLLRMDVRVSPEGAAKMWVLIEDEELEPPVVCNYEVDPKEWVTLELDLARAAEERGLNLARMVNIYVFASVSCDGQVHLDNVRVATRDVAAGLSVLKDERPMALSAKPPEKPELPAVPRNARRNSSPVELERHENVAEGSVVPLGWVAAYDDDRLFLAYTDRRYGEKRRGSGRALFTLDGGKTWRRADDPIARNLDHGTSRGNAIDANGDGIVVSSAVGCAGLGRPTPRQHCSKYAFTGDGWELRKPATIVDCDIRHCGSNAFALRVPSGTHAGRIWIAWGTCTRLRTLAVHAKFSDDHGLSWHSWREGKSALIPGSTCRRPGEEKPNLRLNTYAYPRPRVARFGEHVAVFWQDARGLCWSYFDGGDWTPVEVIDAGAAAVLETTPYESFRVPGSCVTRGTSEVFLTAWNVPGVLRFDGGGWRRECREADDAGMLTLCGDGEVMLITSGHVPEPLRLKVIEIIRRASVLCYRRPRDGAWAEALDVGGGPVSLHQYRQMPGVSVPPYSPRNFAPVAWSDGQSVTVASVPVLQT